MDISKAKALEIILCDGNMSGSVILKLLSSDLVAVKVPRCDLACRGDLFGCASIGVYFLFGDDESSHDTCVYVGESETMFSRLKAHLADDNDWHTAIAFCSPALNKAIIRFVENALTKEIKSNGYNVITQITYGNVTISTAQTLAANQFMKCIRELLDLFGFSLFAGVRDLPSLASVYRCGGAQGFPSDKGFTVLKRSAVCENVAPSLIPSYKSLRDELFANGVIKDYKFKANFEFTSPSSAASVIKGCTTNGREAWSLPNGKTLRDVQEEMAHTK